MKLCGTTTARLGRNCFRGDDVEGGDDDDDGGDEVAVRFKSGGSGSYLADLESISKKTELEDLRSTSKIRSW